MREWGASPASPITSSFARTGYTSFRVYRPLVHKFMPYVPTSKRPPTHSVTSPRLGIFHPKRAETLPSGHDTTPSRTPSSLSPLSNVLLERTSPFRGFQSKK